MARCADEAGCASQPRATGGDEVRGSAARRRNTVYSFVCRPPVAWTAAIAQWRSVSHSIKHTTGSDASGAPPGALHNGTAPGAKRARAGGRSSRAGAARLTRHRQRRGARGAVGGSGPHPQVARTGKTGFGKLASGNWLRERVDRESGFGMGRSGKG
jgi:hypothetical protein